MMLQQVKTLCGGVGLMVESRAETDWDQETTWEYKT